MGLSSNTTQSRNTNYFIKKFSIPNGWNNVLYVHNPFCKRRCRYCVYYTKTLEEPENDFECYCNGIKNDLLKYKNIFSNVAFDEIYFGGGTPTIFTAAQLETVFNMIPNFQNINNKCIEVSPETFTEEHLLLLQKYNFKYISVGIQSLNEEICRKQNRYFLDRIAFRKLCNRLRNSGILFNLDFICFMNNGDIRDLPAFEEELDFVLKNSMPSFLTIQSLYQSISTLDRSKLLIQMIQRLLNKNPNYTCMNSLLEEDDYKIDALYNTEYKLGIKGIWYSNYLFNKFSTMPVKGYNILAIGDKNSRLVSNAGAFAYQVHEDDTDTLYLYHFNDDIFDRFEYIRKNIKMGSTL